MKSPRLDDMRHAGRARNSAKMQRVLRGSRDVSSIQAVETRPALCARDIGTDFEVRVWETLLKIPMGRVTHIGWSPRRFTTPKGARAVGAAVGKTRSPSWCRGHASSGKGGDLTGYYWGLTRKRRHAWVEPQKRGPCECRNQMGYSIGILGQGGILQRPLDAIVEDRNAEISPGDARGSWTAGLQRGSGRNAVRQAIGGLLVGHLSARLLRTSGKDVGLPPDRWQLEVGHLNIGAGRIVMQDLPRIGDARCQRRHRRRRRSVNLMGGCGRPVAHVNLMA